MTSPANGDNASELKARTIGPAQASVTLVEYGDFECPNCKQAAPAVKFLLHHFAGRIRFVFRHFPLEEVHAHALHAAEAAEAAAAEGKFWEMHDLLFANQTHLTAPDLHRYAEETGLDIRRYQLAMQEHQYLNPIRTDQHSGRERGVRATPTFFLNGNVCDVSFGIPALERAIEAALRGER